MNEDWQARIRHHALISPNWRETNVSPIGLKLGVAFALLVGILIGISVLGLGRMDQIKAHLEDVLGARWARLQLAREALMYSNENSRITMKIFLVNDKRLIDPLLARRAENTQKISELLAQIKSQCESPDEKRFLAVVEDAQAPYVASYSRALQSLVEEQQPEAARAIMFQETTPALYKYQNAWSKFMQFEMEQINKAVDESRVHYRRARDTVLLLVLLAVLVAVTIAFFVTMKMSDEMRTRILAEQEMRLLNWKLEQRVEQRTQDLASSNQQLMAEIAERKSAEEKYRALVQDAVAGIFQSAPDGRLISTNRAMAHMHGYDSPEQLMAEVTNARQFLVNPAQGVEMARLLEERGAVQNLEIEVYRRDRRKKWLLTNVRAVSGSDGQVVRHEGTVQDITERKTAEEHVHFLAYYDALTGLPNRTLFQDRLARALAGARRRGEKVALLFLDLDNFKTINDSLGHSVGDLILKKVGECLDAWARKQDTVARLGGDEFVVVLTGVKDVASVAVAADRLLKALTTEFIVQGQVLNVSCSVGISVFPDNGTDLETLVKNADAAMYSAKENGSRLQFFTQDMHSRALERLTLESSLRQALEREEFFLVYQPQVDITTGRITGAEALLRWRHRKLGLVPPNKFIPLAENSGLIIPIGEWVLQTACAQARQWQRDGLSALPVAVNVSVVQFRQEGFPEVVRKVLDETGLAPQYLELELTESLLLSNADAMLSVLRQLEKMGIKLTIDDFGTGYSSLSYLKQLPLSKLKIDRSFVQGVTVDKDGAAITSTIISMAKNLNLTVTAEGVETKDQLFFLRAHNCDQLQGYYFSKPLPPDAFAEKVHHCWSQIQKPECLVCLGPK